MSKIKFTSIKLTIIFLMLGFSSCIKENLGPAPEFFIGKWQWSESVGGFGGWELTPQTEGYTRQYKFDKDSLTITRNDTIVESKEAWHISKKKSNYSDELHDYLKLEKHFKDDKTGAVILGTSELRIIELTPHKLVLSEPHFDGFEHTFIR